MEEVGGRVGGKRLIYRFISFIRFGINRRGVGRASI